MIDSSGRDVNRERGLPVARAGRTRVPRQGKELQDENGIPERPPPPTSGKYKPYESVGETAPSRYVGAADVGNPHRIGGAHQDSLHASAGTARVSRGVFSHRPR